MPLCLFLGQPQSRDSGDDAHRVALPARALAEYVEVADIQTLHPEREPRCLQADLLVVVGMQADVAILRVMQQRKQRGLPTVYEISDEFKNFPGE